MLTIDNPVLEKKIMNVAKKNGETAENYIINMVYFYEENKKNINYDGMDFIENGEVIPDSKDIKLSLNNSDKGIEAFNFLKTLK
ncbi:MAG: hypothetical protein Q9M94_06230 [Candidatus Gracilibacteria bacterium]|nr:hypothetical protein [Candidatus Gracilibacteria bacterium]MDQ7022769.1 hypothetical protein [Candidatus Gracilibacteria bacterium]